MSSEISSSIDSSKNDRPRQIITEGVEAGWPICLGYVPIGLAFGVLAQKAGLAVLEVGLMSLLVFAGSAQFIAVSMIGSGAASLSIVLTTLIVNLRHVLMSSSLAVFLGRVDRRLLSLFAYGVTDESFAVNMTRFREGEWTPHRALVVNHIANFVWIVSTMIGAYGGHFIPAGSFGIDYALSAMFLSLMVFQLRGRIYVITGLLAGLFAVLFAMLIPGNAYVILASLLAATSGFLLKRFGRKKMPYDARF